MYVCDILHAIYNNQIHKPHLNTVITQNRLSPTDCGAFTVVSVAPSPRTRLTHSAVAAARGRSARFALGQQTVNAIRP